MDDTERIIKLKIRLDGLEEWVGIIQTKVDTINERTKRQTKDIQDLRRQLK